MRERELQFGAERDRLSQDLEMVVTNTHALRQSANAASSIADSAAADAGRAGEAFEAYSDQQRQARDTLASAVDALTSQQREEATLAERLEALRDEYAALRRMHEHGSSPDDAQRALARSSLGRDVIGRLRDACDVSDPKAAALLEAAFGGGLDDFIIRAPEALSRLRDELESLGLDRIRVRLAGGLRGWPYAPGDSVPKGDGVLGTLADIVDLAPGHPESLSELLRGVIVAEDLTAAVRLRATRVIPAGYRVVTMDGDAIDPDGAIRVGRPGGGIAQVLTRLRALGDEIPQVDMTLGTVRADAPRVLQAVADGRATLEATDRELANRKAEHVQAYAFAAEASGRHQLLDAQAGALVARQEQIRRRLHDIERDLGAVGPEIHQNAANVESLERQLAVIGHDRDSAQHAETRLAGLEATLAGLDDRRQDLESQRESQQAQLQRMNAEIDLAKSSEAAASAEILELDSQAERVESEIAQIAVQVVAAEAELRESEASAIEAKLDAQRLQMRASQQDWERRRAEEALTTAQAATERLAERREELRRFAIDELSLESPTPVELVTESVASVDRRIVELRRLLETLGPVNPLAPDQYRNDHAQLEDSKAQITDLEGAEANLRNLALELQRQLRDEFLQTFNAVNTEFSRLFAELFGGGEASMTLTSPNDVEQTGVEIHVRLPGKRRQELALLSGGERALVSTTLVLALLYVRPSPFCTLDEVDAALDENNVGRFCAQLHKLSHRTQFVVITHNPVTVQAADTIFGVTMGEDGISQVLSLRLAEVNGSNGKGRGNGFVRSAGAAALPE